MKKTVFLISIMGLLLASCQQNQQNIELIPYRKGDKWGFCTPDKKIVITPKYDGAGGFIEGLAWVLVAQLPLNSNKAHYLTSIHAF